VDGRRSVDLPGCGLGQVDGCCEHGNKYGHVSNCQLLERKSSP